MQHHGWLETMLQARFPTHELVIRNLGFSGDELTLRLRSKDFGSPDDHLRINQADVIFAFFGYNESFAGEEGLNKFRDDLRAFINHTRGEHYNGEGAPTIVLFSPIAHEDVGDRNLPDGSENNARIAIYTAAMAEVAEELGVRFVDINAATAQLYDEFDTPLTFNGIHLTEDGNRQLAEVIDRALFASRPALDVDETRLALIRAAVMDKNFHWYNRHRTVDGYSIFGGRADLAFVDGQTNREVMHREIEVLDVLTANRDRGIWAAAQGRQLRVDDSNTPPFIPVETNKPGPLPGGKHVFLTGEEAISKMQVADGLRVELVASEAQFPDLESPVQMAFDTKGRLWVAAWESYPHWKPKDQMNDKLLIIEDTNGDGRADKCKTFAGGLHNPTGFEFWGGGVLVAMAPELLFLQDTDGDDVADVRRQILHGLDTADTHHTANSFAMGPGGDFYFQEGTFHHTQVETPYGPPVRSANAAVYRYVPRTQEFDVYVAYGFANPHGHAFSRWGQDVVHDGTGAVPYHAALFSGRIDFPRKHAQPPTVYQQRTRPCGGTETLSSRHFPEANQGNLLVTNVIGFQGILQYEIHEDGASFSATEVDPVVFSSDPNFRPVDMEMGPDGALYFIDWQNPIIGHMQHNLRDPSRDQEHGRVYRVTVVDRPLLDPPLVAGQPIKELLELLKEPEDRLRSRVRIELSARDSEAVIAAVDRWIERLDEHDPEYEHHVLEALWMYQQHNMINEALLRRMLTSPDHNARAAATRVLCSQRVLVAEPLELLAQQIGDAHPLVRLEALRSCSFFRDPDAAEVALMVLEQPMDKYVTYLLAETLKQLEPYWREALANDANFAAGAPTGLKRLLQEVPTAELVNLPHRAAVFEELLSRPQVLHDVRHEAVHHLAMANGASMMTELMAAVDRLDRTESSTAEQVLGDLAHMITAQPETEFSKFRDRIEQLARDGHTPITRQIAYVMLITADGGVDAAWQLASRSLDGVRDLLRAVPLVPDASLRALAHPVVAPLVDGVPTNLAEQADGADGGVGRYVRIELPGEKRTLTLAEVEVISGGHNVARDGESQQPGDAYGGVASRAIDGNKDGTYGQGGQTHTPEDQRDPFWEVDLGADYPIEQVIVYNRSESDGAYAKRLDGFTLQVLNANREEVFERTEIPAPDESIAIDVTGNPVDTLRRAAINALTYTGVDETATFQKLASLVDQDQLRGAAVRGLGRMPRPSWPLDEIGPLVGDLIDRVSQLPAGRRTEPLALDELALAKRLATALPQLQARETRERLREIGVTVVQLRPVPHKMIYDRSQIFVEAGRPVELLFENVDVMPHNLVVVKPGTLAKVGIAAEEMATSPDAYSRNFVPDLDDVLYASKLAQPGETTRVSFTAPTRPGEFPYVCTFPGHWRRMYGTMHVVENLDDVPAEVLAPTVDPEIQTRPFVRSWTLSDLIDSLDEADSGRDFARAESLLKQLSCAQCHRIGGEGPEVGPDLAGVKKKLADGDFKRADVLREMVEPSAVIDVKYKTVTIVDTDGRIHNGIATKRDDTAVRLLANPLDSQEPVVIPIDAIEQEVESTISMMPAGLLNTLTKDEILDLLMYIESSADSSHAAFGSN
jgi:putative heme-binding domain-containing protein